ncbi:MAG: hypothetical protein ACRDQ1_16040, partial [Sciscionella sp.]
ARPCGLLDADGQTPAELVGFVRGMGVRDGVLGLAMAFAPGAAAKRTATWARVCADLADAAFLGGALPDRSVRGKVAMVAGGWAALTALSARTLR